MDRKGLEVSHAQRKEEEHAMTVSEQQALIAKRSKYNNPLIAISHAHTVLQEEGSVNQILHTLFTRVLIDELKDSLLTHWLTSD